VTKLETKRDNKAKAKCMFRLFHVTLLLIFLTSSAQADVKIFNSTVFYVGDAVYTVERWDFHSSLIVVNDSQIALTGLASGSDCIANTTGLYATDSTSCTVIENSKAELLWVNETIIVVEGNVEVLNFTGNTAFNNMTLTYNHSGSGNMTLNLRDLDGDCNYAAFRFEYDNSSILFAKFPRSLSELNNCTVMLQTNSTNTSVGGVKVRVFEDEGTSEASLSTLFAATAVTIIIVTRGLQWGS